jgi:hypothetical protein
LRASGVDRDGMRIIRVHVAGMQNACPYNVRTVSTYDVQTLKHYS